MIHNDVELQDTQERIAFFPRLVANMRQVERLENFKYIASKRGIQETAVRRLSFYRGYMREPTKAKPCTSSLLC
jgi:hypothetical protein